MTRRGIGGATRQSLVRWLSLPAAILLLLLLTAPAAAHVVISPVDSVAGATQLYTISVPSERRSETVKIEVQFPRSLVVLQVQAPPGWRVTPQKDNQGRILGATWEGDGVPFEQFVELHVLAQNPRASGDLSWSVIQTYADGNEVQWSAPESGQFPAGVTHVHTAGLELSWPEIAALAALIIALVALVLVVLTWRRVRAAASASVAVRRPAGRAEAPLSTAMTTPATTDPSAAHHRV